MARTFIILGFFVWEFIYAPMWWYTVGALREIKKFIARISYGNEYLGLTLWAKNIFVPMYGQRDLGGRIISAIVRILQIIVRAGIFVVLALFSFLLLLLYFSLPVIVLWQIVHQWLKLTT